MATTWVLLFLFVNTYGHESTTSTSITGFASEAHCEKAAQKIKATVGSGRRGSNWNVVTTCVEQR